MTKKSLPRQSNKKSIRAASEEPSQQSISLTGLLTTCPRDPPYFLGFLSSTPTRSTPRFPHFHLEAWEILRGGCHKVGQDGGNWRALPQKRDPTERYRGLVLPGIKYFFIEKLPNGIRHLFGSFPFSFRSRQQGLY